MPIHPTSGKVDSATFSLHTFSELRVYGVLRSSHRFSADGIMLDGGTGWPARRKASYKGGIYRVREGEYLRGTPRAHGRKPTSGQRGGVASRQADGGLQGHDRPR